MAGPGRSGPPQADTLAQVEYETARYQVLHLHCRGFTQVAIAKATGYSERTVRRIIKSAFGEEMASVAFSDRAGKLLMHVVGDHYIEVVAPQMKAMRASGKFDKKVLDLALASTDKMARLSGLY